MKAETEQIKTQQSGAQSSAAQSSAPLPGVSVRLAYGGGVGVCLWSLGPYKRLPRVERPAMLVSYVILKQFQRHRGGYGIRDWVLDSGAFSAFNSGENIRLCDYIGVCRRLRREDLLLSEVFALDVIGDWRASLRNAEAMWKAGVEAIPTFHIGEPWDVLRGLARDYPKVAIGGVAKARPETKMRFAEQCFARVWPKRLHGFGFGHRAHIVALPWHSVDATSWVLGPSRFGRWNSYGRMDVRGKGLNLRVEVEYYLQVEREARRRWRKEFSQISTV